MNDFKYLASLSFLKLTRKFTHDLNNKQTPAFIEQLDEIEQNLIRAQQANNVQELLNSCKRLISIGEAVSDLHRDNYVALD